MLTFTTVPVTLSKATYRYFKTAFPAVVLFFACAGVSSAQVQEFGSLEAQPINLSAPVVASPALKVGIFRFMYDRFASGANGWRATEKRDRSLSLRESLQELASFAKGDRVALARLFSYDKARYTAMEQGSRQTLNNGARAAAAILLTFLTRPGVPSQEEAWDGGDLLKFVGRHHGSARDARVLEDAVGIVQSMSARDAETLAFLEMLALDAQDFEDLRVGMPVAVRHFYGTEPATREHGGRRPQLLPPKGKYQETGVVVSASDLIKSIHDQFRAHPNYSPDFENQDGRPYWNLYRLENAFQAYSREAHHREFVLTQLGYEGDSLGIAERGLREIRTYGLDRTRTVLAILSKTGHLFLFDFVSGKILFLNVPSEGGIEIFQIKERLKGQGETVQRSVLERGVEDFLKFHGSRADLGASDIHDRVRNHPEYRQITLADVEFLLGLARHEENIIWSEGNLRDHYSKHGGRFARIEKTDWDEGKYDRESKALVFNGLNDIDERKELDGTPDTLLFSGMNGTWLLIDRKNRRVVVFALTPDRRRIKMISFWKMSVDDSELDRARLFLNHERSGLLAE